MRTTDTIVIGAGQAGLAASRHLTDRGHDHVVLERGVTGERWRAETWDSLHLLTPNWFNTLPAWRYGGTEPDGYMSASAFADHLHAYARSFDAPIEERSAVELVRCVGSRFEVLTEHGPWQASNVIVATGWCDRPAVPAMSDDLAADVEQVVPSEYRNPTSLPRGGVLVVGASATGVQLAEELRAAGREVTIAVGGHSRMPRRYRGMDIFWWLDRVGVLDKTIDEMHDTRRARVEPSLQLVGRASQQSVDLTTLQAAGVRVVGRLSAVSGHRLRFAPDLAETVGVAEARMARTLATIDRHIDAHGLRAEVLEPEVFRAFTPGPVVDSIDLRRSGIRTVIWATGHRRLYPWLHVPALDQHGELRQRRGVTPVPGLYVLGQRFQHHRRSNFIGGVGRDAAFVADHIAGAQHAVASDMSAVSGN